MLTVNECSFINIKNLFCLRGTRVSFKGGLAKLWNLR